jgi:hypothetical protein
MALTPAQRVLLENLRQALEAETAAREQLELARKVARQQLIAARAARTPYVEMARMLVAPVGDPTCTNARRRAETARLRQRAKAARRRDS